MSFESEDESIKIAQEMLKEIGRLGNNATSELVIHGSIVQLDEPFTAGLIAIRLYPTLWNSHTPTNPYKNRLKDMILRRLNHSRPVDGGGWPFFDKVCFDGEGQLVNLIEPDADTTAVCWSALLLASEITTQDCQSAFNLICECLMKDGDVYFDDSGRLDIIALCNMLFFFFLFCEKYEIENQKSLLISQALKDGLLRARKSITHVLGLSNDTKVSYWLRYYIGDSASALARVCGFVAPLVLRWPAHSFMVPLKAALMTAIETISFQKLHSFVDMCMIATLSSSPDKSRALLEEALTIGNGVLNHEPIFYTAIHRMSFVSSLFSASCYLAAKSQSTSDYVGFSPNVVRVSDDALRPRSIATELLLSCMVLAPLGHDSDETVLSLACSSSVDGLKKHFNRTFSPTTNHHSLPDALAVSETFRIVMERELSQDLGPRLKSARELLIHCLGLSRAELEGFWTASRLRLQLSVLLTLRRFPNSAFLLPLKQALRDSLDPEQDSGFLIKLVEMICSDELAYSRLLDDFFVLFVEEDVVVQSYVRHITAEKGKCIRLPDEQLELSKFQSHLNYDNLKAVIKARISNCVSVQQAF